MKLKRSPEGEARALQLLIPTTISIYTEGTGIDVFFYENIISNSPTLSKLEISVNSAKILPTYKGNGKQSILKSYNKLLKTNKLFSKFRNGKYKIIMFALDKDVDDIENIQLTSNHIVYSNYYSIENHIFHATDHQKSIGCHLLLSKKEIKKIQIDKSWINNLHTYWAKWISYCLFIKLHKVHGIKNFSSPTQINHSYCSKVCLKKLRKLKSDIVAKSTFKSSWLNKNISQYNKIIMDHIKTGHADKIYNGKWYFHALNDHLKTIKKPPLRSTNLIEHELWRYFINNLDWSHSEIQYFSTKIEEAIDKILN